MVLPSEHTWETSCGGCGTHPSFWKTIVTSDIWKKWEKEQMKRMDQQVKKMAKEKKAKKFHGCFDYDESRECGDLSPNHWAAFVEFIRSTK